MRIARLDDVVDSHPAVNVPVMLRPPEGREYRSRVEGSSAGVLTVSAPLDLPAEGGPGPGSELLVTWRAGRGIAVLPATVLEAFREGELALWSMAPTGPAWLEQRRDFVRVPVTGEMVLQVGDEEPTDVDARLVDVSEAALRCSVVGTGADLVAPEVAVTARFRVGDRDFGIPGRVAFERAGGHPEVVVVFDEPVRESDALRKQIYAQQLRAARRD